MRSRHICMISSNVLCSTYLAILSLFLSLLYSTDVNASNTINPVFLPFDPLSTDVLRASPRKTFARWHVEPLSTDNKPAAIDFYTVNMLSPSGYKGQYAAVGGLARQRPLPRPPIAQADWKIQDMATEIERAIGLGLDGFAFSIYQLSPKEGWNQLVNMLEAAQRVDSGFRIMLYLDYASLNGSKPTAAQLADALASVASHPSVFHTDDGRLVIMGGAPHLFGYAYNAELISALASRGISVFFIDQDQQWTDLDPFAAISDGYARFGAQNPTDALRRAADVATTHAQGKLYMGVIVPQIFRPRRGWYVEAQNSSTLRATWKVAIDSQPDWLLLRNWNDYSEGNQVSPATGTQWAIYDLCAYYNTWYKTQVQPKIKRDVLYYIHRIQATTTMPDPNLQSQLIVPHELNPEEARDNIELLAFLSAPGTLEITIGGKTLRKGGGGIMSFKVPLENGIPTFRLKRNGQTIIQMQSAFEIRDQIQYQDLLYRAGSSTRPVVEMVANPPIQ